MEQEPLTFYTHGPGPNRAPFLHEEILPFSHRSNQRGIVLHFEDIEVINDGNVHVYYKPVQDSYVLEYNEDRIYVREGDDFEELDQFFEFAANHFYGLRGTESEFDTDGPIDQLDPYQLFVSRIEQHTSGSLEQYIESLLRSMEVEEEAITYILGYINVFHVALVDQDSNPGPLANYELLEFVGDLAAWKPMTSIFLDYARSKGISVTEQVLTAMHRSYSSKEKQAEIARKLALNVYLKKKGEITIDTFEDLFESFTGAMFFVNFHLKSLYCIDIELHERFLRWVYRSWDLSGYEEKPEITRFYEYMRILVGRPAFKERKVGNIWIMRSEPGTFELLAQRLRERSVEIDVKELIKLIQRPYQDARAFEERKRKYHEINVYIDTLVSSDLMRRMANDRNTTSWSKDQKEQLDQLLPPVYLIRQRFVDKSRSTSYWIIEIPEGNGDQDSQERVESSGSRGEPKYSTLGFDRSEDPETLLSVIRDGSGMNANSGSNASANLVTIESYIDQESYLERSDGSRVHLSGSQAAIEEEIRRAYDEQRGRFYLVLSKIDGTNVIRETEGRIELDPTSRNFIGSSLKPTKLLEMLESIPDDTNGYSDAVYRYIGDRAAYGYSALIAVLKHQITSVHHLTAVRNFYRSKELKGQLSKSIGVDDLDIILGRKVLGAEEVVTYIYMNVPINSRVIYRDENKLKSLRLSLIPTLAPISGPQNRAQVQAPLTYIKVTNGNYVYEASNGSILSVAISGFNYEHVREAFSSYVLAYEKKINPNYNQSRNRRFSSLPGFDSLKQAMEFKHIQDWQLFKDKRKAIELRYFTESGNQIVHLNGSDLGSIMKQL